MTDKRIKQIALIVAGLIALAILIIFLRVVIIPLAISWLIAYIVDPVLDKLQKIIKYRTVNIIIVMVVLLTMIVLFLLVIVPVALDQTKILTKRIPDYQMQVKTYIESLLLRIKSQYPHDFDVIWQKLLTILQQQAPRLLDPLGRFFYGMFGGIINFILGLLNIIIIPVMTFYFLREFDNMNKGVISLVPVRYLPSFMEIMREIDSVLGNFLRGQLTVALILAALYIIGLSIAGVPMAYVIGFIAGLANMVPYLGLIVGLLPAIIFTLVEHQSIYSVLGVLAVFAIAHAIEGTLISPRIIGDRVRLHPLVIMSAVIIGGSLFGFAGLVIAVPITAVLMVLLRAGVKKYKASPIYTGKKDEH